MELQELYLVDILPVEVVEEEDQLLDLEDLVVEDLVVEDLVHLVVLEQQILEVVVVVLHGTIQVVEPVWVVLVVLV
jgi:hypothetical protein